MKTLTILDRTVIKATGIILYTLLSSNGVDHYFATVKDGKVTAHDCPAACNNCSCYHVVGIERIERDLAAAETELRNEAKMRAFKSAMHAQYASDPRLSEAEETARCYRDLFWDDRF